MGAETFEELSGAVEKLADAGEGMGWAKSGGSLVHTRVAEGSQLTTYIASFSDSVTLSKRGKCYFRELRCSKFPNFSSKHDSSVLDCPQRGTISVKISLRA